VTLKVVNIVGKKCKMNQKVANNKDQIQSYKSCALLTRCLFFWDWLA